ncbi:MAG TPA: D-alanyl-D-alanine carboxypeptidase [Fibrobacteria bacterium]|nr:D-alanyl-D-alanine carboxypeptidase [Fibrobacteria bacterium]
MDTSSHPPVAAVKPPDPRAAFLPPGVDTALWISMDSLLASDFAPMGGVVGAHVARLGDTAAVWWHNPDTRLLPASTQKVYTAVAGMSILGPKFRWRTTLWRTGTLYGADLKGDLILEGGGDPTLGSESGALSIFVSALKKQGVVTVHGNLIAMDTVAGRGLDAWPGGWTIASAKDGYGAPVVGLNWNQNRIGDRALPEPRQEALKALRKALAAKGITVKGTDTTIRVRGDSLPARRNLTRVATVASPALDAVLRSCLRESVNPFAEGVVLGLGLGRRGPVRDAGLRRLRDWLTKQGLDPARQVVDDGSGLSRYDLTTARQMTQFLSHDARTGQTLLDLLPKGGEGTLRKRFQLFPVPSQVLAKTGTLDGVSNLAGYLVRDRDTLAFTFFCSGYTGYTRPVRELQDRWLARLQGLPLVKPDSLSLDSLARTGQPRPDTILPPTLDEDSTDPVRTPSSGSAAPGTPLAPVVDTARIVPPPAPIAPRIAPQVDSIRPTAPVPPQDSASQRTLPNAQIPSPQLDSAAFQVLPPPDLPPEPPQPTSPPPKTNPVPTPSSMIPADSLPPRPAEQDRDPLDSFPRPFDPDRIPD